ncbi:hypothetical protein BC941DRAFT_445647 [Chlamydoabsidia padenii]|nr:hypothetical protein BC941DRAFT_445647 [Chlamydoabsidia padenii]
MVTINEGGTDTMEHRKSTLPTLKTANLDTMRQALQSRQSYLNHASIFYGIEQSRNRFKEYQGQQRAIATTVNIAFNGGKSMTGRNAS